MFRAFSLDMRGVASRAAVRSGESHRHDAKDAKSGSRCNGGPRARSSSLSLASLAFLAVHHRAFRDTAPPERALGEYPEIVRGNSQLDHSYPCDRVRMQHPAPTRANPPERTAALCCPRGRPPSESPAATNATCRASVRTGASAAEASAIAGGENGSIGRDEPESHSMSVRSGAAAGRLMLEKRAAGC